MIGGLWLSVLRRELVHLGKGEDRAVHAHEVLAHVAAPALADAALHPVLQGGEDVVL